MINTGTSNVSPLPNQFTPKMNFGLKNTSSKRIPDRKMIEMWCNFPESKIHWPLDALAYTDLKVSSKKRQTGRIRGRSPRLRLMVSCREGSSPRLPETRVGQLLPSIPWSDEGVEYNHQITSGVRCFGPKFRGLPERSAAAGTQSLLSAHSDHHRVQEPQHWHDRGHRQDVPRDCTTRKRERLPSLHDDWRMKGSPLGSFCFPS